MKTVLKIIGYVALSFFAIILLMVGLLYNIFEEPEENKPFDEPIEIVLHVLDKNSQKKISSAYGRFTCRQPRLGWDDPKSDIYHLKEQADGTYKIILKRACESYSITINHSAYYEVIHFVDFSQPTKITAPIAPITIEMDSCNKPRTIYKIDSKHGDRLKNKYIPFMGYKYNLWNKHLDSTQRILKVEEYGYDIDEFTITSNRSKADIWLEDNNKRFKNSFDDFNIFMKETASYEWDENSFIKLGKRADFIILDENGREKFIKSLSIASFKIKGVVLIRWEKNGRYTYLKTSLDHQLTYDLEQDILRVLDPESNLLHGKKNILPPTKKEEWIVYTGYALRVWYQTNGTREFYNCGNLDFKEYLNTKSNPTGSNKVYK